MKRAILIIATFFGIVLFVGYSAKPATDKHTLWMDNVADHAAGQAFESAFVTDTACHGLHLALYSAAPDTDAFMRMRVKPHWETQYSELQLQTYTYNTLGMVPFGFEGPTIWISDVKDAREAAHKACLVANEKGGTR